MNNIINPDTLELVYKLIEQVCTYNNNICMATNDYFCTLLNKDDKCGLVKKDITNYIKELKNQGRILVIPGQNRRISLLKNIE